MKKLVLLCALFASCSRSTTAPVLGYKTVDWKDFTENLRFEKTNKGGWEFFHNGRAIYDYTVVKIPANTFRVTEFHLFTSHWLYLTTVNPLLTVNIENQRRSRHQATASIIFFCKLGRDRCRNSIDALLSKPVEMQSLGVGADYETSGKIPQEINLTFLLRASQPS